MNAADFSPKAVTHDVTSAPFELDERMLDASRFPLVRLRSRAVRPGYAFAWSAQMRRLVALATPFVLVAEHDENETADDARLRAAWMRAHRATLAAFCRGLIVIEPRIEARAGTRETLRAMTEGSGVRTVVVSSMRVAGELAPVLLKHAVAPGAAAARTQAI
ncbi:hypothetical protein AWB79_02987 [Caballeronia hypogeia]|uniref:Uncharacterized protein n=1 Tax=Caballeronia hypogeia TaxID=1777140 RepID=A0A158AZS3_9BURK|nr:hypothetical protein [Caballeronia hypogeia]SAK63295.1 hypothetical protein AWB79_02987 [Caballeronia hypogeia]